MKMIRSLAATLTLAGLFGAAGANAADASEGANANCRQETKRVAVWPRTPPKAPQMARFEERQVTVCDDKRVDSKKAADEQLQAKDSDS